MLNIKYLSVRLFWATFAKLQTQYGTSLCVCLVVHRYTIALLHVYRKVDIASACTTIPECSIPLVLYNNNHQDVGLEINNYTFTVLHDKYDKVYSC